MQKETLILASNNAGKLREMREILEPFGLEVRSQKEAGFTAEVAETGTTFQENAIIKAKAVQEALHCSVLAEEAVKSAVKDYYDKNGIAYDKSKFPDCESCESCRMV